MPSNKPTIGVFILAKNEEANIARSLAALQPSGWPVHVLDSGSTDGTEAIVKGFDFARFEAYRYSDHCAAYNEVCTTLATDYAYAIVLDSDMQLLPALIAEVEEVLASSDTGIAAYDAEIEMCSEGIPLRFGSLCPPKPFLFKTGQALFVRTGHAERLADGVAVKRLRHCIRHDDRKSYASYLQSQFRYAGNLVARYRQDQVSGRDRLRVRTPLLILAVPFVSYVLKLGFLDGRAGLLYALDRFIAEAIMYRQALAERALRRENEKGKQEHVQR